MAVLSGYLNYIEQMLMEEEMEERPSLNMNQKVSFPHRKDLRFDACLEYIEQMLDEEDIEEEKSSSSFHVNPLALKAMEKSFYQVLCGEQYSPSLPNSQIQPLCSESHADDTLYSNCYQNYISNSIKSNNKEAITNLDGCISEINTISSENKSFLLQFQRGVEEASKFLPCNSLLSVCLYDTAHQKTLPPLLKDDLVQYDLSNSSNYNQQVTEGEDGRKKHSLKFCDEDADGLLELFEKLYIGANSRQKFPSEVINDIISANKAPGRPSRSLTKAQKLVSAGLVQVDLWTLLMICAQAISADNQKRADELLKQIRQHSSSFGDCFQRLAHYFANALESRLAGIGAQLYETLGGHLSPSAIDIVKGLHSIAHTLPFRVIDFCFTIHHISNLVEKSSILHIIEFGIHIGYRCSRIIHQLSSRHGGLPSKLRITGIEDSQESEMVKKTGHRLAKYCERYNVQFEYSGIAQNWETIQIKDLKINEHESTVVISMHQFEKLLDEVVGVDCTRSVVLNLIRQINPDIFIHSVKHGSYNIPLFYPRFRGALYHYSSMFDMLDVNLSRDSRERSMFESAFFGREILNIIACEGAERVERVETYQQWQLRMTRAGFRPLNLDGELVWSLRTIVNSGYHKDFMIEEDGNWILQGWKGRTLYAISCWVPA